MPIVGVRLQRRLRCSSTAWREIAWPSSRAGSALCLVRHALRRAYQLGRRFDRDSGPSARSHGCEAVQWRCFSVAAVVTGRSVLEQDVPPRAGTLMRSRSKGLSGAPPRFSCSISATAPGTASRLPPSPWPQHTRSRHIDAVAGLPGPAGAIAPQADIPAVQSRSSFLASGYRLVGNGHSRGG